MPELPEVETVRRGLVGLLGEGAEIAGAEVRRRDLRRDVPRGFARRVTGRAIESIERRAKVLLWRLGPAGAGGEGSTMLSHLGMTGQWRIAPAGDDRDHDHLVLHVVAGTGASAGTAGEELRLVYRDPRRFGWVDLAPPGALAEHPALRDLGPEPLGDDFTAAALHEAARGRTVAIKALLMNPRIVVGVGNIYAAEALFRARVCPATPAGRLSRARCGRIVDAVRATLAEAIDAGGSTIRDYRNAGDVQGWFQEVFQVYGRAGEPCPRCDRPLRSDVIAQRTTVWCTRCQR